jgi:hypothetical protein
LVIIIELKIVESCLNRGAPFWFVVWVDAAHRLWFVVFGLGFNPLALV